ncbi:OLC1v1014075C1 [Oldenlandia corymbosa var. corymbosa]|uniref:OLC1v1014075C1 n=1 Tax=Oldenlandia corymbosa var. corymbosa TaxID=529605 RepID=A0AAV1E2D1_OLDCO|nr:OLC1v1014075C1 [Oldenlandia corymbosa var. corymbosa]
MGSFKGFSSVSIFMIIITFFFCMQFCTVLSVNFEVGAKDGWAIPPSKNQDLYNDWASKNRFQVNDTLHFTYNKDSVLVVTQEEYKKCHSDHPLFYSNDGSTEYTLDRSGFFYFISGVSGHCDKGLKMIIKVMEEKESLPPQSANETSKKKSSSADFPVSASFSVSVGMIFIFALFGAV